MATYGVVDKATGRLYSISSEIPSGLSSVAFDIHTWASEPDQTATVWNPATRTWVTRPVVVRPDRLSDMKTNAAYADFQTVYNALTTARKASLDAALVRLLGGQRFRDATDTVGL